MWEKLGGLAISSPSLPASAPVLVLAERINASAATSCLTQKEFKPGLLVSRDKQRAPWANVFISPK